MIDDQGDRSDATNLKGWLSDVYFQALIEGQLGPFALRLGARATIDEPQLGRAVGMAGVEAQLGKTAEWLKKLGATYERGQFTTGIDRDVTEGTLTVRKDGAKVEVPVAVVAERRKSREVELRVYYAARLVTGHSAPRASLLGVEPSASLPTPVCDYAAAAKAGNVAAVLATFEANGVLRDATGGAFGKANGTLEGYYGKAVPLDLQIGGYADDGRACAVEYSVVRVGGREISAQAGLAVYERGDSGLLRAVRVYDDVAGG
jgi:hypothetical protein